MQYLESDIRYAYCLSLHLLYYRPMDGILQIETFNAIFYTYVETYNFVNLAYSNGFSDERI